MTPPPSAAGRRKLYVCKHLGMDLAQCCCLQVPLLCLLLPSYMHVCLARLLMLGRRHGKRGGLSPSKGCVELHINWFLHTWLVQGAGRGFTLGPAVARMHCRCGWPWRAHARVIAKLNGGTGGTVMMAAVFIGVPLVHGYSNCQLPVTGVRSPTVSTCGSAAADPRVIRAQITPLSEETSV